MMNRLNARSVLGILALSMFVILSSISQMTFGVTEQVRVSANNDDAEERITDGDMYRNSSDLELGYDSFVGSLQIVGMRFRSVDIPQGATINSAYIKFETDETGSGNTNLVIYGEATDSSTTFANNDYNISSRAQTTASVAWSPAIWGSVNELHQTPDLAAIIQEIVNRPLWLPNNNLTIIIEPGAGCTTSACRRTAESHDGESGAAPLLVIDYNLAPEIGSVNGSCSALQNVTVVYSTDVEESSAELVSNYQLTNPAGNVIALNSATLSASNTVTLSAATVLNDLTEYTLTINNVENLSGNAIAASSSSSFMLSCNLNCISDNFAGPGPLSSEWSTGSSSGSFGNPRIVTNGRLRLTDATGNVATVATLLNQFPGAENRIEVEFDYYAYNGSGADGIAVTFSDAAVAPSPGGYGGSLGYAQRTGIGGFTGGWLGIGIDEYGNFSNPTEGRQGGSGFVQDSVSLRGSGSGTSGYPYLTGTGTLSPGIDQSGSTPAPGHRYKIIIDHTMGGAEAYVTVARDTGSGYVDIIPRFDIYALNPSQAAVPTNWVLSFTGSTGGLTNIHEIGDLQVCAALPIDPLTLVDHYEITHSSPGVTCESSLITVTAHDASHTPPPGGVTSDTYLTVTTSPAVTSIISSPATITAGSSSTTFYLNQSSAQAGIDIDVTDGTATDLDDGSAEDLPLEFLATAFLFSPSIGSQIAGKSSSIAPGAQVLTLRAVRTSTDTGACEAALTGTQAVDLAYECNNPSVCTTSDLLSVTAAETKTVSRKDISYTSVNMTFDATGSAPFSFTFSDAGEITLHAQKSVLASSPEPAFTLIGSSNAFVARPFGFYLDFADLNAYAAGSDGSVFRAAGANFDMQITAKNWEGADDADNNGIPDSGADLTDNASTLNFGKETAASSLEFDFALKDPNPATSNPGTLIATAVTVGGGATSFAGGVATSTLSWDEVGIIDISVALDEYLADPNADIAGIAANVGRFTPHHFAVTPTNGAFAPSCGSFSYIGQPFGYATPPGVPPGALIIAQNADNGTTQNYTETGYMKLNPGNITRSPISADVDKLGVDGNPLAATSDMLPGSGTVVADLIKGQMIYTFDPAETYVYTKDEKAIVIPFYSKLTVNATTLADSDGVAASVLPSWTPAAIDIRYGRWNMENAFGPETSNLAMDVYTEYLDVTGSYRINSADSCTNLSGLVGTPLAGIVSADPTGTTGAGSITGITIGSETTDLSFNTTLSGGEGQFTFTAPDAGNTGAVDVYVDLSALPWLQFDWNSDGTLENHPKATATFGQYRGNDRIIYWREVEN